MSARRLIPLGLLVAVLLAAAGIASHGRPLTGGRAGGPTATFFDYVATTLVLVAFVFVAVVLYTLLTQRASTTAPRRGRWHLLANIIAFALAAILAAFVLHTNFIERFRHFEQRIAHKQQVQPPSSGQVVTRRHSRNARLRWDEIGVFLVLVAGTGIVLLASRRTRKPPKPWRFGRTAGVAEALDASIDDLRADPDLRRAIIAAYARMEDALGRAGLPRRASEAPFEYMERALRSLASASAAERLTGLFEWAKFSHHEPAPDMRDEAIDALVAVRDELAKEPVTA